MQSIVSGNVCGIANSLVMHHKELLHSIVKDVLVIQTFTSGLLYKRMITPKNKVLNEY